MQVFLLKRAKTQKVFTDTKKIVHKIAKEINDAEDFRDKRVVIEVKEVDEFEFQLKVGSDLIVFILQSNVVALPTDHKVYKQKYVKEEKNRAFFGQIMVYNYMADTVKYNRHSDIGYLIERIFVNIDDKFYVEGMKNLNFSHLNLENNEITNEIITELIEQAILIAIDTDLVITSYEENFVLTLEQKYNNRSFKSGKKFLDKRFILVQKKKKILCKISQNLILPVSDSNFSG